jgi:hypothetical protein
VNNERSIISTGWRGARPWPTGVGKAQKKRNNLPTPRKILSLRHFDEDSEEKSRDGRDLSLWSK